MKWFFIATHSFTRFIAVFLVSVFSLIIFSLKAETTLSQESNEPSPSPTCVKDEGRTFCDPEGGEIVRRVNCDGSTSIIDYCRLYDDKRCLNGGCKVVYETKLYIEPSQTQLGEGVDIYATGTRTCAPSDPVKSFYPGAGLHNIDNFDDPNCKLVGSSCEGGNPKDGYRCWWQYQCVAFRLSEKTGDSNNPYKQFTSYFPNNTSNLSCISEAQYTVTEPNSCSTGPETEIIDPNGEVNNNIISKTLNDDKRFSHIVTLSSQPPELYREIAYRQVEELPEVGVQLGFFSLTGLRQLICKGPFITALSGLGIRLNFCPVDVNLTSTNFFAALTKLNASSQRPEELRVIPSQKSCYLLDIVDEKTGTLDPEKLGNKRIDEINTSLAAGSGIYDIDTPEIMGYKEDHNRFNVSLNGVVVNGDLRSPNVNCMQQKFLNLYYPPGYVAPYFQAFGCDESQTTVPDPGSITACARWPINNPLGNFGDPQCNFTKDDLYNILLQHDPQNARYWFNIIVPCESGYNPNAYNPLSPDPAGAWGLFQMGRGKNGPLDHGDVEWVIQITNAIGYNKLIGNSFAYWQCAR